MIEQARIDIWNGLKRYYGAIQEVVNATTDLREGGYTRDYIYKVLSGKRNNIDILNLAAEVLKRHEEAHAVKLRRLQKAVDQVAAIA
jgi:hypothetical protein